MSATNKLSLREESMPELKLVPPEIDPANPFANLDALRNPQDYAEFANGEAVSKYRVRRLKEAMHLRVYDDPAYMLFNQYIVEPGGTGKETFFVFPQFRDALGPLTRKVNIHVAVDGHAEYFLLMIRQAQDGQDPNIWYDTARMVAAAATKEWVKVHKPIGGGWGYSTVSHEMLTPAWPTKTMHELLQTAFEGRIVMSFDHDLIKNYNQRGA
jgi:hypothetical protein